MLEFDSLPSFQVFPFGVILFDFLFLLVAIPIEAYVINSRLKFDKRTSVFYAISMNVFSNVIGWIFFFLFEGTDLFNTYKVQLINYLLYNNMDGGVSSGIVLGGFITFFATLMIKFAFLRILILSLSEPGEKKSEAESSVIFGRKSSRSYRKIWQSTSLFTTTLIANSFSYSAITLVILFRFFALTNV